MGLDFIIFGSAMFLWGIVVGFGILYTRLRRSEGSISELKSRLKKNSETTDEARWQVDKKEKEMQDLRAQLEAAHESKVASETRYEDASRNLVQQKRLIYEVSKKFQENLDESLTKLTPNVKTTGGLSDTSLKNLIISLKPQALGDNAKALRESVEAALSKFATEAKSDPGIRQEAVDELMTSVKDILEVYEERMTNIGKAQEDIIRHISVPT